MYSWYQFDGKYICVVCGVDFKVLTELITHLPEHQDNDLLAIDLSRFMLGRSCAETVKT